MRFSIIFFVIAFNFASAQCKMPFYIESTIEYNSKIDSLDYPTDFVVNRYLDSTSSTSGVKLEMNQREFYTQVDSFGNQLIINNQVGSFYNKVYISKEKGYVLTRSVSECLELVVKYGYDMQMMVYSECHFDKADSCFTITFKNGIPEFRMDYIPLSFIENIDSTSISYRIIQTNRFKRRERMFDLEGNIISDQYFQLPVKRRLSE